MDCDVDVRGGGVRVRSETDSWNRAKVKTYQTVVLSAIDFKEPGVMRETRLSNASAKSQDATVS
jgi:hypothetical protein